MIHFIFFQFQHSPPPNLSPHYYNTFRPHLSPPRRWDLVGLTSSFFYYFLLSATFFYFLTFINFSNFSIALWDWIIKRNTFFVDGVSTQVPPDSPPPSPPNLFPHYYTTFRHYQSPPRRWALADIIVYN